MKKFVVSIPITGAVSFEVEAEDQGSAIEAAWAAVNEGGDQTDLMWEYVDVVMEGNCFHGMQNEIEVTEID